MELTTTDEGRPVFVSVEDVGPVFGRLFITEADSEASGLRSWRVEIPHLPYRMLIHPSSWGRAVHTLGRAVEVRIWGAIGPEHYTGHAYGQLGDALLESHSPHRLRFMLCGTGPILRYRG